MTRVEASVDIRAPLAEVFTYASDWRKWEDWWEGVSDFKPTTELTRGNGTRYAYRAWIAGITLNLETEIHEFEENVGWIDLVIQGTPIEITLSSLSVMSVGLSARQLAVEPYAGQIA